MRKFNLKGTVIQRMRGIEREEPRTVENVKTQIEETPVMSVDFECNLLGWRHRIDSPKNIQIFRQRLQEIH